MGTYFMLNSWTEQGSKNIKSLPTRARAGKKAIEAVGGKMKGLYLVMGLAQADTIAIFDAPDDETAAKAAIGINSAGAVRTQTVRAFTEQEFQKIIASLS